MLRTLFSLFLVTLVLAVPALAQETVPPPEARQSPLMMARTMLDDGTYVKITYSSPRMRGRTVYGGLVPYGEIWRLGANEATEITNSAPIMFGGEMLPAGTHTLFAMPGEDEWTIIVNETVGQWGAFDYDPTADRYRFTVPVASSDQINEALSMSFDDEVEEGQHLVINWAETEVRVPVMAVTE